MCLSTGGIDTSVHFASCHPSANGSPAMQSVDSVSDGTRAAMYAGCTTVGQSVCLSVSHFIDILQHCCTFFFFVSFFSSYSYSYRYFLPFLIFFHLGPLYLPPFS